MQALMARIQSEGLREPLWVIDRQGKPKIEEGNHRLAVLERLGWDVPIEMTTSYYGKLAARGALDDEPLHDVGAGEPVSDRDLVKLYVHGYTDIYPKLEGAVAKLIDREGVTTPTLYRGDRSGKQSLVDSWTTNRSIAERFASERGGSVVQLPAGAARGVSTNVALGPDASSALEDFGDEDEWLLKSTARAHEAKLAANTVTMYHGTNEAAAEKILQGGTTCLRLRRHYHRHRATVRASTRFSAQPLLVRLRATPPEEW